MTRSSLWWAGVLAPALAFSQPQNPSATDTQKLTVQQAMERALAENPGLQAARLRQEAIESTAASIRGRFLPSIHLSEEQDHYDKPFDLVFPLPKPAPSISLQARAINTNTFVAAAGQPILGLLRLTQDHAAVLSNAEAANEQALSVESMIREAVQTGYLRYFEAVATRAIAQTSEQQLSEQYAVAQSKFKAGVLTNADLLRLQVAAANAKQQEIQANAQAQITRSALLTGMGYAVDDSRIEFVEPVELETAAVPVSRDVDAQHAAIGKRHEVLAALKQADGAAAQERSKFFQLWPDLNAEAAYVHLTGQVFAPADSFYVGLKANWNIWEWGAGFYDYKASQQMARAARLSAEEQGRQVSIDASTKLAQAQAAAVVVNVAQATIASAEEAYRVTDALVKAGSATTTDLLDAQGALTQAKLNLVRAKYEQAIATVAFSRATGG